MNTKTTTHDLFIFNFIVVCGYYYFVIFHYSNRVLFMRQGVRVALRYVGSE